MALSLCHHDALSVHFLYDSICHQFVIHYCTAVLLKIRSNLVDFHTYTSICVKMLILCQYTNKAIFPNICHYKFHHVTRQEILMGQHQIMG